MVRHFNPTISEDAQRILNSKTGEHLSSEIGSLIPVIPIERYCDVVDCTTATANGNTTLYTTPANKDFYLTAIHLSYSQDGTAVMPQAIIRATIKGVVTDILIVDQVSGAIFGDYSDQTHISFPRPLKIDRNTNILINLNVGVANVSESVSLYGYTVETVRG